MISRSHRTPASPALWAGAMVLSLAAALPAGAAEGDQPAAEPEAAKSESVRTVTVGNAKINLHLAPAASAQRAALVAAFKQATAAHLTGGEPFETPKAEPVELPSGHLMMALPTELMHTMFVGPAGQNYCADSTVAATAAVKNVDLEGR